MSLTPWHDAKDIQMNNAHQDMMDLSARAFEKEGYDGTPRSVQEPSMRNLSDVFRRADGQAGTPSGVTAVVRSAVESPKTLMQTIMPDKSYAPTAATTVAVSSLQRSSTKAVQDGATVAQSLNTAQADVSKQMGCLERDVGALQDQACAALKETAVGMGVSPQEAESTFMPDNGTGAFMAAAAVVAEASFAGLGTLATPVWTAVCTGQVLSTAEKKLPVEEQEKILKAVIDSKQCSASLIAQQTTQGTTSQPQWENMQPQDLRDLLALDRKNLAAQLPEAKALDDMQAGLDNVESNHAAVGIERDGMNEEAKDSYAQRMTAVASNDEVVIPEGIKNYSAMNSVFETTQAIKEDQEAELRNQIAMNEPQFATPKMGMMG